MASAVCIRESERVVSLVSLVSTGATDQRQRLWRVDGDRVEIEDVDAMLNKNLSLWSLSLSVLCYLLFMKHITAH